MRYHQLLVESPILSSQGVKETILSYLLTLQMRGINEIPLKSLSMDLEREGLSLMPENLMSILDELEVVANVSNNAVTLAGASEDLDKDSADSEFDPEDFDPEDDEIEAVSSKSRVDDMATSKAEREI